MTKHRITPVLVLLGCLSLPGCDPAGPSGHADAGPFCDAFAAAGLLATVVAADGASVCDATVTARFEGDGHSEVLMPGFGCRYVGAYEQPGRWTVSAARNGAVTATVAVDIDWSDWTHCHVAQREVRLQLP